MCTKQLKCDNITRGGGKNEKIKDNFGYIWCFFITMCVLTSVVTFFDMDIGVGGVISGIMSLLITFVIFKKKYKTEIEKIKQENMKKIKQEEIEDEKDKEVVYKIEGVRGRNIRVYKDKAVIIVKVGFGSFLTGNASDGEKTIYYKDVISVQFKKSGVAIGYLQLETASATMNNKHNNFFNENSFTFDTTKVSNEKMEEVANYVKKRVETYKTAETVQVNNFSMADEIKKYKELLDIGAITQEEFDVKKKELLK